MHELRHALDRLSTLSDAARTATEGLLSSRRVAAGESLLRAGERANRFYFVREGLLREYYVDTDGRESTRQFSGGGEFSGSLADLLSGRAAEVSIDAMVPSVVFEAEWARLDTLSEQHPSLMKLLRRVAENLYLRKTRREFEMLTLPAAERYRRFVEQYPDLDSQLHRRHVASYLGISPVHLSRIASVRRKAAAPGASGSR